MNIMSDLLEISDPKREKENVDDMLSELMEIKRALDYSVRENSEHEFIYSIIKFAKMYPNLTTPQLIKMSLEDWGISSTP